MEGANLEAPFQSIWSLPPHSRELATVSSSIPRMGIDDSGVDEERLRGLCTLLVKTIARLKKADQGRGTTDNETSHLEGGDTPDKDREIGASMPRQNQDGGDLHVALEGAVLEGEEGVEKAHLLEKGRGLAEKLTAAELALANPTPRAPSSAAPKRPPSAIDETMRSMPKPRFNLTLNGVKRKRIRKPNKDTPSALNARILAAKQMGPALSMNNLFLAKKKPRSLHEEAFQEDSSEGIKGTGAPHARNVQVNRDRLVGLSEALGHASSYLSMETSASDSADSEALMGIAVSTGGARELASQVAEVYGGSVHSVC